MKYALFLTAILSIASLADASSHNRILKKRTPAHLRRQFGLGSPDNARTGDNEAPDGGNNNKGVINPGGGPSVAPQDPTASETSPITSPTPTSTSDTKETQTSTTDRGGILDPILNPLTDTSTSSSSSSTLSTSSTFSSSALPSSSARPSSASLLPSSSIPLPSSTPSANPTPTPLPVAASQSTVTATLTGADASETSPPAEATGGVTKIQRNTIIVLVVIAGSIALIALVWTIIRKWKFSPSSEFEDRMQPIDWQPTPDDGIMHRPRPVSHGSFTSADSHGHGYGATNNYNNNLRGQDYASDLPPHDLLSGTNHTGYADLHRGPSPQPYMSEGGPQRAPSLNRAYY